MVDEAGDRGGQQELSPQEEEQRLYREERRNWLIWTFGIAGAIAVVVIAGTIMIAPWPDPAITGSTPNPPQVETPAP